MTKDTTPIYVKDGSVPIFGSTTAHDLAILTYISGMGLDPSEQWPVAQVSYLKPSIFSSHEYSHQHPPEDV